MRFAEGDRPGLELIILCSNAKVSTDACKQPGLHFLHMCLHTHQFCWFTCIFITKLLTANLFVQIKVFKSVQLMLMKWCATKPWGDISSIHPSIHGNTIKPSILPSPMMIRSTKQHHNTHPMIWTQNWKFKVSWANKIYDNMLSWQIRFKICII